MRLAKPKSGGGALLASLLAAAAATALQTTPAVGASDTPGQQVIQSSTKVPGKPSAGPGIETSIASQIDMAFDQEPRLRDVDYRIDARTGTVTLTGRVPSAAAAERAKFLIARVPGVNRIDMRLGVGPAVASRGGRAADDRDAAGAAGRPGAKTGVGRDSDSDYPDATPGAEDSPSSPSMPRQGSPTDEPGTFGR